MATFFENWPIALKHTDNISKVMFICLLSSFVKCYWFISRNGAIEIKSIIIINRHQQSVDLSGKPTQFLICYFSSNWPASSSCAVNIVEHSTLPLMGILTVLKGTGRGNPGVKGT